jgi:hypothetical protein
MIIKTSPTSRIIESNWLDYAYAVATADDSHCLCKPSTNGRVRWPGFLGQRYAEKRVLFLGARHNTDNLFTGALREYAEKLRTWASRERDTSVDAAFLEQMRKAHRMTFDQWSRQGVWKIFKRLSEELSFTFEQVAFANLAKCYAPNSLGEDDVYIPGCSESFDINVLVNAIQPTIIFFAKDNAVGRAVHIDGEGAGMPFVRRYSNGSRGSYEGMHYTKWIPMHRDRLRRIIETPAHD